MKNDSPLDITFDGFWDLVGILLEGKTATREMLRRVYIAGACDAGEMLGKAVDRAMNDGSESSGGFCMN